MRISESVGSAAAAVKQHTPNATPLKNACINFCTAALTKIWEWVKSACRNSYDRGSAAFAKVDRTVRTVLHRTVRTVLLRRRPPGGAYERIPAEEVEEREGPIPTPVETNSCSHGGAAKSVSYTYVYLTFAKIGYAVRVKVVCRIVQRISDNGTKSNVSIHATNFVHESDDGGGQDTVNDACKKHCGVVTTTFAKTVDDIREWMADPVVRSRIIMYTNMLSENVRIYSILYGLPLGGVAFHIIIAKNLIDITYDVIYEKVVSQKQISNGSQESIPGPEMDDKWYSRVFEFLKDNEFLFSVLKEFGDFLRMGHSRYQYFRKGVFTTESLVLIMRKFFEFVMKRHCSTGFVITQEIVMRIFLGTGFLSKWGFHASATKGKQMKKGFHFHGSATNGKKMKKGFHFHGSATNGKKMITNI